MKDYRQKNKIVIPAKAGIQKKGESLDFFCQRNDELLNLCCNNYKKS